MLQRQLKAIFGAVSSGLGVAYTILATKGHISFTDGVYIGLTTLTTYGAVWGVTNAAPPSK